MEEVRIPYKAAIFVQAWKRWDLAAMRTSTTADIEHKNGRRFWPSINTLKRETDEMVDAKIALCNELGVNSVYFGRSIQELRRDGVDHAKCVKLIIQYLGAMI